MTVCRIRANVWAGVLNVAFDFAIMSLPRSGSHMLMSALHSHPEITMKGELRMKEKFPLPASEGALRGCICPSYSLPNPAGISASTPIIFLKRDIQEIDRSPYHQHLAPAPVDDVVPPKSRLSYLYNQLVLLEKFIESRKAPKLEIWYDELCGGEDVRVLDQSERLCCFLGISEQPLRPLTYKPN